MKLNQHLINNRLFLNCLSIVTIVTLLVAVFSDLTASNYNISIFFCSDTLYLPSLYKDLIIDKNSITSWELNPAPNYFPDMLFYFIVMFITNNFVVTFFIFSIVQFVLLGFLFVKIFRLIFPSASAYYNLLIYSLLSFYLLEYFFFTRDFFYIFFLLINSYHTGAFVISLLCVFLSFKYIRDKKIIHLVLIFFLGFLMVVSDKLFVVLYIVPICLSCVLMYKKIGLKTSVYFILICGILTILGLYVSKQLVRDSYNFLDQTNGLAKFNVMQEQFSVFFKQIFGYISSFGVKAIGLYLFMVSVLLMGYVFINSFRKTDNVLIPFYALFSLIFTVVVICAPMISGIYRGGDCIRYNIYPFYLAILNITVFFFYFKKNQRSVMWSRPILLCLNGLLLVIGFLQLSPTGLKEYFNYYPEYARLVDEVAEKENLKYGVANYWHAKKITMFSKKDVKMYAVFDDIACFLHVANNSWFFDNMFNFVLITGFDDTTIYRNKLKDIRYLSNTPQFKLIKARPFYYSRFTGSGVRNTEIKEE